MNNMVVFAKRLKEEREKAHLTQAQLAQKVGVSSQTISAYEKTGEKGKTPTLDNAAAIARELKVSLDYLIGSSQQEEKTTELKDLAEVVDYLRLLTDYFDCEVGWHEVDVPEELWQFCDFGNGTEVINKTEKVATIAVHNYGLAVFFENRNKLFQLFKAGTISEDMYQTWLSGEIQKMKTKWRIEPITDHGDFM